MATIRDVARLAEVSVSTVSLALSNPGRVSQKTLERIRTAVAAVGYVADPLAQSLARGRSKMIGLVVGNVGNPFFGDIRRELENYALEHEHFVLIADSSGKLERERALVEHLIGLKIAGLALAPSSFGPDYVKFVESLKVPMVCFDQKVAGIERDFVGSDNYLAGAMLTEHLLQLGHRRIAFIAGPQHMHTASERYRGFMETMASAGVDVNPNYVVDGQFTRSAGYEAAMRLLIQPERPTAILGANNAVALAALQAMQELGFDCPGDISLCMIDDVQWSNVITPRITMVVQDTLKLGGIIARRLLHRISTPDAAAEPPQDFVLAPKFVPGNSCRRV
ncbi:MULTISPECIES: LacI family DNA-binding transcriptional regulator [unclassified Devosia]|uniref:LacI family DNA-binding transcriptional regulator n=1 Tax=unclassified Devosia TaxID=196773 RepID=UPI00086E58D3|nr:MULTISPECIES: LacI family DNA-binding transcriptional regulator [unclassified Devosia]MBN9360924.1 LacI family DNA-binding transcriptional regulator [Devosia sp.]ODS86225.1 MAG: LacI family transcriptional regulator [Devosia sp. SCN 66-27]OJX22867.1 MAG: LacI family transcriptional regulator [Devosia sp. 66-14]